MVGSLAERRWCVPRKAALLPRIGGGKESTAGNSRCFVGYEQL
jgi:hypothetical protein